MVRKRRTDKRTLLRDKYKIRLDGYSGLRINLPSEISKYLKLNNGDFIRWSKSKNDNDKVIAIIEKVK